MIKIPQSFFGFLLAALLFWLLINLSKEYTTTVNVAVAYNNIAANKVIINTPPEELTLNVTGTGFKLIIANFSREKISFDLKDLKKRSENYYFLLCNNYKSNIQKELLSGLQLVSITKDSIIFNIQELQSKKLPIEAKITTTFTKGFDLTKPVQVSPDSITVSGTDMALRDLKAIPTKKIEIKNIASNTTKNIPLDIPENIRTSIESVTMDLYVDRYTEGTLELPVTIINLPKEEKINIYPNTVKVTFKVGLQNFGKINSESFYVFCDYQEIKKEQVPYLIPKVESKSTLVSSVRILPEKIDFLIHR
ncbi:YbbR-like domain-containing protein [Tenacibaculum sp. SG-28]|uniref:CdaR family protein n=1 Tax=Tenacibaculum sp. SG-28 TaxID=754426 RepID=UPI0011B04C26|nr:hypothetical protein [Tenacibaculum sp. SG-28]